MYVAKVARFGRVHWIGLRFLLEMAVLLPLGEELCPDHALLGRRRAQTGIYKFLSSSITLHRLL